MFRRRLAAGAPASRASGGMDEPAGPPVRRFEAAPPGGDLALGVFPYPSGAWLSIRASDDAGKLVVDLPEPGKYVLRVMGRSSSMRSVEPYRLALEFR